jgi:DNA-binding NarL/FixJ family response regulator
MIRVLIVDDQVIVCEGLKVVLNSSPIIQVVGMAHDGAEALAQVAALTPDLVLMDLKMPGMNGVRATQAISRQHPGTPVLVLTTYDEDEWVVDAIRAGAAGYLLKDTGRDEIIAAIEGVMAGRTPVDPAVASKLFSLVQRGGMTPGPDAALTRQLSERELAVLRLLASGLTNAAIADRLGLAEGTVRNHITAIFAKLDVTDRAQATALAWRYRLVVPDAI